MRLKVFILLTILFLTPTLTEAALVNRSAAGPRDGLVGHWTFDGRDIVNGVVRDISGQGNHGNPISIASSTFYATGKIGQGGNFDGSDDYVNMGDVSAYDYSESQSFSISYWFRDSAAGANHHITKKQNNAATAGYAIGIISSGSGSLSINLSDGVDEVNKDYTVTATGLANNAWHHVVMVINRTSNTVIAYVDGTSRGEDDISTIDSFSSSSNFRLSGLNSNSFFNSGLLDDVRIYNRALSSSEIRSLYNIGSAGRLGLTPKDPMKNGLVGHWTFDGNDIRRGVILDKSGQGNNGNPVNIASTTFYATGKIGQGAGFDGVDDYVRTSAQIPSTTFTLSFWMKGRQAAVGNLFAQDVNGDEIALSYISGSDAFSYENTYNTSDTLGGWLYTLDSDWHHIVLVEPYSSLDVDDALFYVDGNLIASGYVGTAQSLNADNLNIAARPGGTNLYEGTLDDVRIYNRALSANEVRALYSMGGGAKTGLTPREPLKSGLIGHWTFDGNDVRRGVILDKSGQGNNGNPINIASTTFYTAGKIGQGGNFDKINDYIITSSEFIGTEPVTVSAWIYPKSFGENILGYIVTNKRFFLRMRNPTNSIYASSNGGTSLANAASSAITLNTWQHVAVTRDGSGLMNMYVNGVLSGTANQDGGTPEVGTGNVSIGGDSSLAYTFDGVIDDTRIYNRVLSATEIMTLYNMGR